MTISDILREKGANVITVSPDMTVLDAMRELVRHGIGAVVVTQADEIAGIITERDMLRHGVNDPHHAAETTVRNVMTTNLVVGVPDDSVEYVMEIMTRNRIRHLPVIDDGQLAGILSIGDVVNALRTSIEAENRYLREYIQGVLG